MASSYSNIHPVDQILTNLAIEAIPSDDQLIADKVFEKINIPERSGTLPLRFIIDARRADYLNYCLDSIVDGLRDFYIYPIQ